MEESVNKKFYVVEVNYWPQLDMARSNTFIIYTPRKPQAATIHGVNIDTHRVYFEDPVEAEDYRQRVMADYEGEVKHENLQQR